MFVVFFLWVEGGDVLNFLYSNLAGLIICEMYCNGRFDLTSGMLSLLTMHMISYSGCMMSLNFPYVFRDGISDS